MFILLCFSLLCSCFVWAVILVDPDGWLFDPDGWDFFSCFFLCLMFFFCIFVLFDLLFFSEMCVVFLLFFVVIQKVLV